MDKSCLKSNGQNLLEVGMTRLLTYRQCCKFSRHGCWIKLTPTMGATLHSKWDCGASPTRLRQGSNELEHVGRCKQGLMSLIRSAVEASYLSRDQERMQHVTCFFGRGFVWQLFKINFQNRTMSCDCPRPYALRFSPLSPTLSPSFNDSLFFPNA